MVIKALQIVGSPEHKALEWQVAKKAVTLIKNDNATLPLDQKASKKVAILCPYNSELQSMEQAIARLKQDNILTEGTICEAYSFEKKKAGEIEDIIKTHDVFLVISEMSGASTLKGWQAGFIDGLNRSAHEMNKKVILISAKLPYDAARYQDADAILLTYCAKNTAVNILAAIYSSFEKTLPTGRNPVDIAGMKNDR